MRICVEGGCADQRAALAGALDALGHEIVDNGPLRLAITPPLEVDRVLGRAIVEGRRVRLTRIELALLSCLIESPGTLDKPTLIARVWGYGFDPGTNIVAVHVSRLRAKLGPTLTIRYREGYRIEAPPSPAAPAQIPRIQTPARRCS